MVVPLLGVPWRSENDALAELLLPCTRPFWLHLCRSSRLLPPLLGLRLADCMNYSLGPATYPALVQTETCSPHTFFWPQLSVTILCQTKCKPHRSCCKELTHTTVLISLGTSQHYGHYCPQLHDQKLGLLTRRRGISASPENVREAFPEGHHLTAHQKNGKGPGW